MPIIYGLIAVASLKNFDPKEQSFVFAYSRPIALASLKRITWGDAWLWRQLASPRSTTP
jgi:hypothetical protein